LLDRIVRIAVVKSEAPFGPLPIVHPLWRAAIVALYFFYHAISYPILLALMISVLPTLVVILSSRIIVDMIVIVIILSIVLRRRRSLRVILLQVREKMVLTW
jgi:hypothetical protein